MTCYGLQVRLRLVLAVSIVCIAGCPRPAEEPPSPQRSEPQEPQTSDPPPSITAISVTVTPAKLFVRGKPLEQDELQARLEALAERTPDATVAVQADATVVSKRMAEVLKTIKAAGFSNVAVATRPVQ